MILTMPFQTTAGTVRRLRISLPLIADLIDGRKYFLPDDLAPPVGEELRPIARPKIGAPRLALAMPVKPPPPQPGPRRTRTPWWLVAPMTRKPRDPLADHLARRRIDRAQYLAGREFQKHMTENGQGAAGGIATASQKWLAKCTFELGQDGTAIVSDALVRDMTTRQIAETRGKTGPQWERFYSRRLWECLNTLVEVYGFASRERTPAASLHADT